MEPTRYLEIFIADDSYAHIRLLQFTLNDLGIRHRLSTAADGEKAVDFFLKRGDYAAAPDADIAFLDLYMPRLNGIEVLQAITDGKVWPVCVLTTSELEKQIVVERFKLDAPLLHCEADR